MNRRRLIAGLGAGLIAPTALSARMLRGGIGIVGGYVPGAVHFDGATNLINSALVSSDNGAASFSLWFKNPSSPASIPTYFVVDPEGSFICGSQGGADASEYGAFFGGPDGTINTGSPSPAVSVGSWHNLLVSIDVRRATPVMTIYLDDVLVSYTPQTTGSFTGSSVLTFNGLPLWIGADSFGDNSIGDAADWWIAPGVSLLDGGGDTPLATRRKFIDGSGKPVYLGANGELPTGTPPAVFLSGDASSFGTNRGTGGAFATTGAFTNAGSHP